MELAPGPAEISDYYTTHDNSLLPLPQINISDLQAIPLENNGARKNFVGNAIYPIIEAKYGGQAPRLTGMLLDETRVNFNQLLTS